MEDEEQLKLPHLVAQESSFSGANNNDLVPLPEDEALEPPPLTERISVCQEFLPEAASKETISSSSTLIARPSMMNLRMESTDFSVQQLDQDAYENLQSSDSKTSSPVPTSPVEPASVKKPMLNFNGRPPTTVTTVTTSPTRASKNSAVSNGSSATNVAATATAPPLPPTSRHKKNQSSKQLPFIPAAASTVDSVDRIRLGICAMDKKARSKPMAEILSRLDEDLYQVVFFGDSVIINEPIENWPVVDVVIAFFSKGYPLNKAKEYVALRKPYCVNDLENQRLLQDRRRVYDLLQASGIDVPRHAFLSRDGYVSTGVGDGNGNQDKEVQEFDDHIEVNGLTIHKPFVEKPVDAEDHNIAIYYPTSAGGGCKKLFRKIGNRSSEFYPGINDVRRDGSFIYEEFVETQGTDVKMYTVGPEYGHAEARKSPTVDGKVERNSDGKEVRFPVILTSREKEIARRIVLVFKQFVCGFDILRVQEGHSVVSYVCDVNGWSFVKNSRKYYDDCSQILSEHILALVKPNKLQSFSTLDPLVKTWIRNDDLHEDDKRNNNTFLSRAARMLQGEPTEIDDEEEDERTADNASVTSTSRIKELPPMPDGGSPNRTGSTDLLLNAAATLMEGALPVRDLPNELTSQPASLAHSDAGSPNEETPSRLRSSQISGYHQEELRCVIAVIRHGDRSPKQKIKVDMTEPHILRFFHDNCVGDCQKDVKVKAKTPLTEFLRVVRTTLDELKQRSSDQDLTLRHQLTHMRDILERWKIVGLNRKLQIKPKKFEEYEDENGQTKKRCTKVQLILKWGGNLTKLGEKQSINLGKRFRHEMYPDAPGGGILRLHSTFRHDLKIKTSDEGRVMKTAAAFAKGLLELEGDLPPILVSLVHKEKGSMHMLDPSGNKEVKMELDVCKEKITANLQRDIDVATASEEDLVLLGGPKELTSLRGALKEVGNPRKMLEKIHRTMGELLEQLDEMLGAMGSGDETRIEGGEGLRGNNEEDVALSGVKLYKGETLLELTERWRFIYDRLYDSETDRFDLSRIPDVHDNVRFDVLHNPHIGLSSTLHQLYELAKDMADCVVPQEYGTTELEKSSVGLKICHSLLEKIKYDIGVARTDNNTDMRYLINMDYSFDLNINTMGRRIRTRLYFSSESHLHTILNVLRFAKKDGTRSLLSEEGIAKLNATPELCYLTQFVMRVFEDSRRDMNDPKRFRVEMLFSPGATATPFHMNEMDREADASRFDTAPFENIGRDDLTCQDVEEFFDLAILAGRSADHAENEKVNVSMSVEEPVKQKKAMLPSSSPAKRISSTPPPVVAATGVATKTIGIPGKKKSATVNAIEDATAGDVENVERRNKAVADMAYSDGQPSVPDSKVATVDESISSPESDASQDAKADEIKTSDDNASKFASRKYFWSCVGIGCFALGVACLGTALHMSHGSRRRRHWR
ncbi:hypothetical protein MPSEU_000726400 [Mayamaea pseudoterrestris]|nr:hypothetical protein MPSEU_000726400 [Mayamaea pseudoterrestris]